MELIEQFVLTILMIYIGYKKAIKFTRQIQQRAAVLEQQQKIADCLKKAEKESFLGNFSPPPRLPVDIPWPEDIHEGELRILKRASLKRESICEHVIEESCDEAVGEGCARQTETIVEDEGSGGIEEVCDKGVGEECREKGEEEYKKRYGEQCRGESDFESSNKMRGECNNKFKEGCNEKLEVRCNDKLEEKLVDIGQNVEKCKEQPKMLCKRQLMEESGKECEGECEERCEEKSKRDLEQSNAQCKERMIKHEVADQDPKNNNFTDLGGSSSLEKEVENHEDFVKDSNKELEKQQVVSSKKGVEEKSNIDSESSLPHLKKDDSNQNSLGEINTNLGSQNQAQIIPKSCVEPVVELGKEQKDKKRATEKCEIGELSTKKEDVLHVILRVDSNQNNDEPLEELREKDIRQTTDDVSNGKYVNVLKDDASKVQKPVTNEDLITDEDKESETASFGTDETATIADDEFYSLCLPHDDLPHLSNEASREISPSPQKTQTEKETSRDTQGTTASKSITNTDVTSKDNTVYLCSAKVRKEGLDPDCQVILKNNEVMIGNCDDVTFTSPGHSLTSQQEKLPNQNGSDDEDDSAFHSAISDVDKNSRLIFSGEYTKAMNKDWHSGHFCCWQCDESLTGQRYVLRDDHPYCIKCYESVFANPCEECNKTIGIDSKDLSYKDKHWHEACFLCNKCHVSLVDKQFGSKGDKIYCGNCYDTQFASRCDGCTQIFRAGTKKMEYKTRQWHEQCFCCCVCKSPIGTKSFIPREQEIYCATCYEEKFATRCVKCNKIITSGGVTYKNEPWHRECFTCTNCSLSLAGQRFTSRDEKPYCADCFGELFAKRCTSCCKPITGIGGTRFISFEDRHWHNDCFICAMCKNSLVGRGFITDGDDIICPDCAKTKLM